MKKLALGLTSIIAVSGCGSGSKKDQEQTQKVEVTVNTSGQPTPSPTTKVTRKEVETAIDKHMSAYNKFLDLAAKRLINPNVPFCVTAVNALSVLTTYKREVANLSASQVMLISGNVTQKYNDFLISFNTSPYTSDPAFISAVEAITTSQAELRDISSKFVTDAQTQTGGNTTTRS